MSREIFLANSKRIHSAGSLGEEGSAT